MIWSVQHSPLKIALLHKVGQHPSTALDTTRHEVPVCKLMEKTDTQYKWHTAWQRAATEKW